MGPKKCKLQMSQRTKTISRKTGSGEKAAKNIQNHYSLDIY